jgi:ribonucleoside-diphosphate reductase alpha subunit
LEPWHADVEALLDLRKTHGKAEDRALDLFYGLWVPDLFMKRIQANATWSLFCPNEAPGLADVWGNEFESLYAKYEAIDGLARKTMLARDLWDHIKNVKRETGTPYIMYKDTCNRLSNQQNLGTIRSSNLCCEIIEYTAPDEIAVCNLASLNLCKFVYHESCGTAQYDFETLIAKTRQVTRNLNHVIDENYYPLPQAKKSNMRHRPIGIGVQALADTFAIMRLAWEDEGARILNRQIFAAIYYTAVSESVAMAKELFEKNKVEFEAAGGVGEGWEPGHYLSFPGSPASKGKFHFDLAGVDPLIGSFGPKCPAFDWEALRKDMVTYGMRNSLLVAPMPTASTSQILGNNECFEPFTTNMYSRRVLAGEFTVVNDHMVTDMMKIGKWTETIRMEIVAAEGSIQNIAGIPSELKRIYKTVWEIPQKIIVQMASDRQAYIDQSQSLNIHMANPTLKQLDAVHFYAWSHGCKCGSYYLRTRPKVNPVKVTVGHDVVMATQTHGNQSMSASDCMMCGS